MGGRMMPRSASADCLLAPASAAAAPPAGPPPRQAPRRQGLALRLRGYRLGLRVPSEMWGATALALRLAQPPAGAAAHLQRSASVLAQAFSSAAAPPPPTGPVSEDQPKALAAALEWRPQLGAAEDWACLLGSAAVCAVVYALTAPAAVQPLYAACMGLLYLLLVAASRTWLVERRYRAIQRSERQLAGSDSRFFDIDGVSLHYKRCTPAALPGGTAGAAGAAGAMPATTTASAGGLGAAVVGAAAAVEPEEDSPTVVHCLHGFGASCYSWSFVQQELADALTATVTAHDMPGFGLSQRPRSPDFYTLHFNGDAARAIMDAELSGQLAQHERRVEWRRARQHEQGKGAGEAPQQGLGPWRSHPLGSGPPSRSSSAASLADEAQQAQQARQPRRICIGHSMGGAAAAEAVIANPEGVAALVLVAPAIVALWMGPPEEAAGNDAVASGLSLVEEFVSAADDPGELQRLPTSPSSSSSSGDSDSGSGSSPPLSRSASAGAAAGGGRGARLRRAARGAAAVAKAAAMLLVRLALLAATPLLVLLLRRLVRARRFWERGLASAWHDSSKLTREYVDAYRSGQLVRGWEGGMLRFLSARFAEKHGFWHSVREAIQGEGHLTQAERLARAVRRHKIKVLVIHGASDALVPAANSRRLAALLPNAELEVFEGCGHMPQEESPEQFVEAVRRFVGSLDA